MSSSNKILDMFDVVMKSDMDDKEKLEMMSSLSSLHENTKQEEELAHDYEQATRPVKPTIKVSFTKDYVPRKTVFGHRRWEDEDRKAMFEVIKDTFGPYDNWHGQVTPGVPTAQYDAVMKQVADHFGRTPLAIKSQIRDVVQPCTNAKNEDSIRVAKKIAFDAGLIGEEELNS